MAAALGMRISSMMVSPSKPRFSGEIVASAPSVVMIVRLPSSLPTTSTDADLTQSVARIGTPARSHASMVTSLQSTSAT